MARTLHADLLTAQVSGYPTGGYKPAVRCILTSNDGGTTHDYSFDPTVNTNRLQHTQQAEERENDSGVILLSNYDRSVPTDLTGYYVDLGWGHNTSSGNKWASGDGAVSPRLWVMRQSDISGAPKGGRPQLYTLFQLQGVWGVVLNTQPVRLGTTPYFQDENGLLAGMTIYGCLEYLIETSLTAQTGLTFTLDALGSQDDGHIDTDIVFPTITAGSFVTGDEYRILTVGTTDFTLIGASANTVGIVFVATGAGSGTGTATSITTSLREINADSPGTFQTYGELILSLLELTKCIIIPRAGLAFKIVYPQSSDAADETYYSSNADGHPFYEVENRRLNMVPNHIEVFGTDIETGVGDWFDSDHFTTVTAGSFITGSIYYILTIGSTDFTAIGATSNTVRLVFTATGAGSGTGTAVGYTGEFMPVTQSISEDGLDTEAETDARAAELGWQLKDQILGTRVIIPMDARVELYDRVRVEDNRGT